MPDLIVCKVLVSLPCYSPKDTVTDMGRHKDFIEALFSLIAITRYSKVRLVILSTGGYGNSRITQINKK